MIRRLIVLCSLFAVALGACKSTEVARSFSTPGQPNFSTMQRSTAKAIIGGKNPCGGTVCTSCRQDLTFPVITHGWGKLRLTAHKGFIALLDKVFTDIQREEPDLMPRIGTAGAICCRLVKLSRGGCGSSYSIHSYGMAVDLKVDGYLDVHGDGCVHKPLFNIHKYMARYGIYWGKDFSTEDAMHWEVSNQVGQEWLRSGIPTMGSGSIVAIPPPKSRCETAHGDQAVCKEVDKCTGKTTTGLCPGPVNIKCCYDEPAAPPPPEVCATKFGSEGKCVASDQCDKVDQGAAYCRDAKQTCCTPDLCKAAQGSAAECKPTGQCDGTSVVNLCTTGKTCCVPNEDTPPIGKITDQAGVVGGWACDADSPGDPVDVHVYVGGKAGSPNVKVTSLRFSCPHCLGKAAPSDADRTACKCTTDKCRVGFVVDFGLLDGLADYAGKQVQIYAYAINAGASVGLTTELTGSPIKVNIPTVIPPALASDSEVDFQPPGDSPVQLYEPHVLPACFSPNACDSSLACCAYCSPLPEGAPCSAASDDGCKQDAYCDGINAHCPSRTREPEGTPCDDNDPCTGPDKCSLDGVCFGERLTTETCKCTSDAHCDDGNPCSKGVCDTVSGQCTYEADAAAAGQRCRRVEGELSCDFEEFCSGESMECPPDEQGCLRAEYDGDDPMMMVDNTPAPTDASFLSISIAIVSISTLAAAC